MTTFYAVQNDNKAVLSVVLRNGPAADDDPIDLTSASAVAFHANPTGAGTAISKACAYAADTTGAVSVSLLAAELVTPGLYSVEWQVTFADGTVTSVPDPGNDVLRIRAELA